tara:strand:- start:161 stop:457 length:297 start_codon:yes stop_codon:yes gene_type:complete
MEFINKINQKKFTLISVFLFLYLLLNLLEGERGLISFYKKQGIKDNLIKEKSILIAELKHVEKKNGLLNETVNLDYLEMLYRQKFMVGKSNEKIYKSN